MTGRRRNAGRSGLKKRRAGKGQEKPATSQPRPGRAQATAAIPTSFQPLVAAFAHKRAVTVAKGWGSGSVVLKVRGKIFAMLMRTDLVLKLPRRRVDELVERSAGTRFDPRRDGRVMKEWIVLRPGAADWVELAAAAFRFVGGVLQ